MREKKILAIFDFCETLVDFQTADRFVEYVVLGNIRPRTLALKALIKILRKMRMLFGNRHKRWRLQLLKGLSEEFLKKKADQFFTQCLVPRLNSAIIKKLTYHVKHGHEVVIVSGGYEIYLTEFAKHFSVAHVIGTRIEFKNGKCIGSIRGQDCMGLNKLYQIAERLSLESYDLQSSYAYSDHPSDIPLLSIVGNAVVVKSKTDQHWGNILGYEVINAS